MTMEDIPKVVLSEDIESELDDAISSAVRIRDARRERLGMQPKGSDVAANLRGDLRAALSQDVVVAVEMESGGINERELEREIIKKALISLDAKALRRLASRKQIPVSGKKEDLATRVASAFRWSTEDVAEVIHDYEVETSTQNGPSTRMFSTRERIDLELIARRLGYVSGRYVRVGLAKWFVFAEISPATDETRISGVLHTFSASVNADDIQRMDSPTTHEILVKGSGHIVVSGANASQAKSCIDAIVDVTGVEVRDYVPNAELHAEAPAGNLHPATAFMLDLIYARLNRGALTQPNALHARFKAKRARPSAVVTEDAKKARLKSVRLDGDYTLDLSQSCQYMTVDRRPLIDVTISAQPKGAADDLTCPVRLSVENDHLHVATGPGTAGIEAAEQLHRDVVAQAEIALTEGISSEQLAAEFARLIRERAAESTDAEDQEPFLGDVELSN